MPDIPERYSRQVRFAGIGEDGQRRLMQSGPTDAELRLAKNVILAQYARTVERIGGFGGKSDMLARCMTFTGNPDCYKVYLERIKAATPAAVRKAMLDWLSDGDFVLQVNPYPTGLAAEIFASTLDVYLTLGATPEEPKNLSTADGRPATVQADPTR